MKGKEMKPRTSPKITDVINTQGRFDFSKYNMTKGRAIRMYCLDCMGGQPTEVRECPDTKCALWRYRNGKEEPFEESID